MTKWLMVMIVMGGGVGTPTKVVHVTEKQCKAVAHNSPSSLLVMCVSPEGVVYNNWKRVDGE